MSDDAVVHIVDDDESLREALSGLFRSVGVEARTYGSTQALMDTGLPEGRTGALVLDVRLPGLSGLDFQARLESLGIRLPVVLMTGHGDIPMSVRGMKAGAIDFLEKPFRDQDMLDAVTLAFEKDRQRRREETDKRGVEERFAGLSPRERQVMALVTAGKLNKQVAFELSLSEITVKIHRGAAMRKMGARSLADLVRMAEALGLHAHTSV
jgi:FixJ family two-component response regulator